MHGIAETGRCVCAVRTHDETGFLVSLIFSLSIIISVVFFFLVLGFFVSTPYDQQRPTDDTINRLPYKNGDNPAWMGEETGVEEGTVG